MSVPQEIMQQMMPPQDLTLDDDALYQEEITKSESRAAKKLSKWAEQDNIVKDVEQNDVEKIRQQIMEQYADDKASMDNWHQKYDKAIDLCKMKYDDAESADNSGGKDFPFEGAAKVMAPFLMQSATEFNARMYMDILATDEVVKPKVVGKNVTPPPAPPPQQPMMQQGQPGQQQQQPPPPPPASQTSPKDARAKRQATYINYQLSDETDWKKQTDKQLMHHSLVGTSYKKVYFDSAKARHSMTFLTADSVIFSQKVGTFEEAPQLTCPDKISRNELVSNVNFDLWDFDLDTIKEDKDKVSFDILEVYFTYDLDGDGYAEPWIATIEVESEKVMRIVAAFSDDGIHEKDGKVYWIDREEFIAQFIFIPDPEGGPMGMGYGILLADMFETINANLRQLIDAGTIQNASSNTGFIASTLGPQMGGANRFEEGTLNLTMGRWEQIQVSSGQKLRDQIVQMPAAGPSVVLFSLLEKLEEWIQRMTNSAWAIEPLANEAASMYLARIREAAKVPNAQVGRFCDGLKVEFKLLYNSLYKYGDNEDYQRVLDEQADIHADFDYKNCDVVPNANPQQGTEAERMAKAELVFTAAQSEIAQGQFNIKKVLADYLDSAGVQDTDSLLPPQEGPTPFEQQQAQAQAAEMELKHREVQARESETQVRVMEAQLKQQQAQMEVALKAKDLQLKDAEIELKQAQAVAALAGVEIAEINQILDALKADREQDQQQQAARQAA